MRLHFCLPLLAGIVSAHAVAAETTLTFESARGEVVYYEVPSGRTVYTNADFEAGRVDPDLAFYDVDGTYREAGFEAAFEAGPYLFEPPSATVNAIFGGGRAYISDCDGCFSGIAAINTMTLSRPDGAAFDLLSYDVTTFNNNAGFAARFTSTTPGESRSVSARDTPGIYNDILFEGVRADGSRVSAERSSLLPSTLNPPFPADRFTDLVALTIRPIIGLEDNAAALLSAQAELLPEPLGDLVELCGVDTWTDCAFDVPVGSFRSTFWANASNQNYTIGLDLNSLTFAVEDGGAAVPLPGAGGLTLAGIGALSLMARRRR